MPRDEREAIPERHQLWWRVVAVAALAMAGASLAISLSERGGHGDLRTSSLSIIGSSGQTVATLAAESSGPVLRMHSEEAKADLLLGAFPGTLGLALVDGKNPRVHLALGENGFPALSLSDREGQTRLLAGLDDDAAGESPFLQLRDASGRVRIFARVTDEPRLLLRDEAGKPVFDVPAGAGDEHAGEGRKR